MCTHTPIKTHINKQTNKQKHTEEGVLDSAGTAILKWLADLNYGNVFAASLFPYLLFLRNIWPKDYPIPKARIYVCVDDLRL